TYSHHTTDPGQWTYAEKAALWEFLYLRETGQSLPIPGPPTLTRGSYMSHCDAVKIYLAHVAQTLWIEANAIVSWKLTAVSSDYLAYLLDMRTLLKFTPGLGHSFDQFVMGSVTDWTPAMSLQLL